jgi:flotillin
MTLLLNAPTSLQVILILVVTFFVFNLTLLIRCYRKATPDSVIIRTGMGGAKVFTGGVISFPIIHQYHIVNIAARQFTLEVDAILKDKKIKKLTFSFILRVNRSPKDVLTAVQFAGLERMSNDKELQNLFEAGFKQALLSSAREFTPEDIVKDPNGLILQVSKRIGTNLDGFSLESVNLV